MSCNYLVKFDKESKYEHLVIPGCSTATPPQAVLKYFQMKYSDINIGNFERAVASKQVNNKIWCKYLRGVSICEDLHEIVIGTNNVMQDLSRGNVKDNFVQVRQIMAVVVSSKPLLLLPYFSEEV